MKIAVTYENGTVFQHFGHTEQFKVYQVEDGRVTGTEILDTNGSGHGALAGFLQDAGVEALICGGLGMGARNALAQAGVTLYAGVTGDADAAVQALLAGRLAYGIEANCSHHDGGHDHAHHGGCASHGCGGHCGA
ncbi:NifB/NifX family molybdenum-iron cluster-binding protein [Intestinimonas butyriciproducens]|uniref:NifB/NifX family molybdenum-iron cluster-binding protein n=1 Tax=Intestinimonas butyriciproducens TaxID=1297617 RepID=UPI00242FF2F1|nr:NifB/NifX family molybdenum-iron cluster-binding protein [Intestinimonas butyriciproducens]